MYRVYSVKQREFCFFPHSYSGFYLRAIAHNTAQFRAIVRNSRTVARNFAQLLATELRLETLAQAQNGSLVYNVDK